MYLPVIFMTIQYDISYRRSRDCFFK